MSAHFMAIPLKGDLEEYGALLVFMAVAFGISLFLLLLSRWRGTRRPDPEKLSPYECGFPPFGDARVKFDVRFYLIALLFIIFDLEVAFLFPWAVSLRHIGLYGFFSMLGFLIILGIGLLYEWRKGALEWE